MNTVGLDYRSDTVWEHYIDREIEAGQLRYATDLFRRVIGIPTKLYNKHWDNFIGNVFIFLLFVLINSNVIKS